MVDVRCQKLISEFGLSTLLKNIEVEKKSLSIAQAMAIAIVEGYKGAQLASPNPLVGCVVVDGNGRFLSKGHHEVYGSAHAEINALRGLDKEHLQNATMIVTLEPCAHVGKTGSCALHIKDLPIKRVIYGVMDPNHLVAGKGAQILKDAGKEAIVFSEFSDAKNPISNSEYSLLKNQIEILSENFLTNFREKRPFVALKWAQSLDGKMALQNFESQWITNSESRNHAHYLRSIYDVTVIGSGTIMKDNPKLNIRLENVSKENRILVLDSKATVFQSYEKLEISKHHKKENVFFVVDPTVSDVIKIFNLSKEPPGAFKNILFLQKNKEGIFPLNDVHQFCFERGMKSIIVEGGAGTLNHYFKQKAFDRVYSFIAPTFMGNGIGYSDKYSIESMSQKPSLKSVEKYSFGDDTLISGLIA